MKYSLYDKVLMISDADGCYWGKGKIGTIIEIYENSRDRLRYRVSWPANDGSGTNFWWFAEEGLTLVNSMNEAIYG